MKLRMIAMTGVLSLAGLGLIGVGAHAAWTTNAASSQTINAGALSVQVSGATGSCAANDAFGNCDSWTLATPAAVGPTFDTTPVQVDLTNVGTVPAYYNTVTVSETDNNSTFEGEIGMCEYSLGTDGHYLGVDYNGLMSGDLGTTSVITGGPTGVIQPGDSDNYTLDFYAGENSSQCGAPATPVSALTSPAEAGSVTVTISYNFTDS